MNLTLLVILGLATYRAARAVAADDITEGVRDHAKNRMGGSAFWKWTYRLISCQQCIGFWLAFIITAVWYAVTDWPGTAEFVIYALAVGGFQLLAGFVSHRLDKVV